MLKARVGFIRLSFYPNQRIRGFSLSFIPSLSKWIQALTSFSLLKSITNWVLIIEHVWFAHFTFKLCRRRILGLST